MSALGTVIEARMDLQAALHSALRPARPQGGGGKKPRREKQRLKPANEGIGTFADHDRAVRERLAAKVAQK